MKKRYFLGLIALFFIFQHCTTHQDSEKVEARNQYADATLIRINTLKDERNSRELMRYLNDENDTYRYEAALAMASIQDTLAIPALKKLVNDPVNKVREAAALALGQMRSPVALPALKAYMRNRENPEVIQQVLEALGKCVDSTHFSWLTNFVPQNNFEQRGMAWGLYRAGLQGLHTNYADSVASILLLSGDTATALPASHYFARSRQSYLLFSIWQQAWKQYKMPKIQMALASVLRHYDWGQVEQVAPEVWASEDYRTRVNFIRTLAAFQWGAALPYIKQGLQDPQINVRIATAEMLTEQQTWKPAKGMLEAWIAQAENWRVRSTLLEYEMKQFPSKALLQKIDTLYAHSQNPYEKAALLNSLGYDTHHQDFLFEQAMQTDAAPIRTAAVTALYRLRKQPGYPDTAAASFADKLKTLLEGKDMGVVAVGAEMIQDTSLHFKKYYAETSFLHQICKEMPLPKSIESVQAMQAAIDYLEGKESPTEVQKNYNHPINWGLVKKIGENEKVRIVTDRGEIILALKVDEAPGSVANFVSLAKSGYFDGKNFHRVVPNFVIQGGCNRGDGYGSENYSIRSEFSFLKYKTGSVGMASAGKDTEGTQWFITHSPTPHLDGRYTIFAEVIKGMDVVHQIQVGDKIKKVEVL